MQLAPLQINYAAMAAATIFSMVIGALWYSPVLFGKQWLNLIGKTREDIEKEGSSSAMALAIIPAIVWNFLLALILYSQDHLSPMSAIITALIISVGFVGMSAANLVIFEKRSPALVLIDVGFPVVSFTISALIFSLWQ